jgi:hemerythrin-like domain-containing protein
MNSILDQSLDANSRKALFAEAKDAIIGHIRNEDKEIYSRLARLAISDDEVRHMLDVFGRSMDELMREVSKFAIKFFDYDDTRPDTQELLLAFGKLANELKARIEFEENELYALYEKRFGA